MQPPHIESATAFSPVRLQDRAIIESLIPPDPLLPCEYCFTNLFIWKDICGTKWAEHDGSLVVLFDNDDELLMPAGKEPSPGALFSIFSKTLAGRPEAAVSHAPQSYVERERLIHEFFACELDEGQADYIHEAENLSALRGPRFHSKKNLLNQFRRKCPDCRTVPVTGNLLDECFALAESWCVEKTCDIAGLSHEKSAMRAAFSNFAELGMEGVAVMSAGKLVAFSAFSIFNGTCVVHFEKYDSSVKGAAQAVNWETANAVKGRCRYINREQDLGIEGLRNAKKSYRPDVFKVDYTLYPKAGSARNPKFQAPKSQINSNSQFPNGVIQSLDIEV